MPISRLQRLFHVCDVFHDFDFVSFCSASPAFFKFFFLFFRPSFLLIAATEGGHYSGSRGVDRPLDPGLPHALVRPCAFAAPADDYDAQSEPEPPDPSCVSH